MKIPEAFSVYLPNPSTARLKIPPHMMDVQSPTNARNIALTGTCTSPNIPSELFLNTGIFTIESVGANMAEITRIIPMAEAVPNIALAEILLPILAPIRRPTNISNQYVAVTEPAMASAPAPFTPNTSKSGFCNHLFNTLGTPTSIPT